MIPSQAPAPEPKQTDAAGGSASPEALNYRPAADPNQSCATCANMLPDGSCTVLQMKVDPAMICDAYMPKGDTMSQDGRASLEDQVFGGGSYGPAA